MVVWGIIGSTALAQTFPADWEGHWSGSLVIYRGLTSLDTVQMSLDIGTDQASIREWVIQYEGQEPRTYRLHTVDASKGHYYFDEQNSILIDAYYAGGKLISWFDVMGSELLCNYWIEEDALHFEVISGSPDPIRSSGDTIMGTDTIPRVSSYPVRIYQHAVMRRLD